MPPPGWTPDPSWGPPPPGHTFWQRTRAGKRRRLFLWFGIPLAVLALFTACGAALSVLPPIEFPPGDIHTLNVHNDTSRTVIMFDCDDERCVRGYNEEPLKPGEVGTPNEDVYTPGPLAIADPVSHRLLGCLVGLPHAEHVGDDYPANNNVKISAAVPCPGSQNPAPIVTFYDPGA
jgi:hypothetical protein